MEITINYYGQAVSVSVEVYEYLTQADHKAENLAHEQRRHWDGREFDEYIIATEGRLPYCATPEELVCQRETLDELLAVLALCTPTQRERFLLFALHRDYLQDPRPEKVPTLGDLYNTLRAQEEKEAQFIATALEIYVTGSLNVFNHQTNVDISNRIVCYDIKELGKQLKQLGMLVIQDQVWNRVTVNRTAGRTTRYYVDEFHLLLKGELASWSVEIWKRFRKWGGIPTGITQNSKDLLASPEIANILENSDFIYMLNQAAGDRQILAKQLNISPHQLSYVTHSGEGEGLLFYGNVILPFVDRFPQDTELYRLLTTKPQEVNM